MQAVHGRILVVDLAAGSFEARPVPEGWYRDWLGGAGLGVRLLWDEIPAGADPLGPDNVLAFMGGLLTGTGALVAGRWTVLAKSPLTGGIGDSNCGGTLALAIKRTGYDGILFRGVSARPVTFVFDEGGPRLEDAAGLWGLDALESEERLLAGWGGESRPAVATIGPAGEKLSLISGISNDGGRYAGRSGLGAVMGSKRLKALLLAGKARIPVADPAAVTALSRAYAAKIAKAKVPAFLRGRFLPLLGRLLSSKTVVPVDGLMSAGIFKKWGTNFNSMTGAVSGDTPSKNWGGTIRDFPKRRFLAFDPDRIEAREIRKYNCQSCVIGCGAICDLGPAKPGAGHSHKPEYETVAVFGNLVLADDLDAVFRCNDLCNRAGLDTISAGSTIAFAIECYERGILGPADTGGLELRWGDSRAVENLLAMMAERRGIGDLLADGVRRAAERIGRGSEAFAVHAGGQEPGMHDPRLDPHLGVAFSADPTPGRHTVTAANYYNLARLWEFSSKVPSAARPYPKAREYEASTEEGRKSAAGVCLKQVLDAAGGCLFALITGLDNWRLFDWLDAATGLARSADEYLEAGHRIQTLRQLFNLREGLDPRDSIIRGRLRGDPPLEAGPLAGISLDIEGLVARHWEALGWDAAGRPKEETLTRLGLAELAVRAGR